MIGSVTRNTVNVQQNNPPENSPMAVQVATPSASNKSETIEKELAEKTNEVAQKTFKKYRVFKAIHKFFSRIFTWIKEIPSKLKEIPAKIGEAVNNWLDKHEEPVARDGDGDNDVGVDEVRFNFTRDDDGDVHNLDPSDDETPVPSAPAEKVNTQSVSEFLEKALSTAPLLEAEICKLQFKVVDDLDPFDKITLEIEEYLAQLSHLPISEFVEQADKAKDVEAKFKKLAEDLKKISDRKVTSIARLRKARELNLEEKPSNKVTVSKPKKTTKPVLNPTNVVEAIRKREIPPTMVNSRNNCYRNSVIALLWAYPDFFKLIEAKEKERAKLNEEFLKEMARYNESEENLKKYYIALKKFESYPDELKKYEEAELKFQTIFAEYDKQFKKWEDEMKKWEAGDKTSNHPTPPVKPTNIPVKPEQIEKPVKPFLLNRPFNEALLLDALQAFKLASESGNVKAIRKAADNLHRTIGNMNNIFSGDGQQDASEFLNFILGFVGVPFEYCTFRQGLNEQINETDIKRVPEKTFQIPFGENPPAELSIQELIQKSSHIEVCPTATLDITKKVKVDGQDIETIIKLNGFTLQNHIEGAPKNLFFNLNRFYLPSQEKVQEEAANVVKKRSEMIEAYAKELIEKNPEVYKEDSKLAKKQAEDHLKKQSNWPQHNIANFQYRKHSTRININKDLTVDLSHLLKSKEGEKINCSYRVIGFTVHDGSHAGGHYTAYIQTKGRWFYANDIGSTVREISQEDARKAFERSYNILTERIDNPEQPLA